MKNRAVKKRRLNPHFQFNMYSPPNKIYKIEWVFHKTDDDPKPSVPHGHSKDNLYRLSIWNGAVYRKQAGKRESAADVLAAGL